ncbi:MAG: hypothetical protein WD226_12910 [Planctomycetota bacterium]
MRRLRLLLVLPLLTACLAQGEPVDPTVVVKGRSGAELGVATPYGVVYLGHRAEDATVELIPAFGDGPAYELAPSVLIAPALRLAISDIVLPTVPLDFDAPKRGTTLTVLGREGRNRWREKVDVAVAPGVRGLLLENHGGLRRRIEGGMVGAGVYSTDDEGNLHLLGLVDGLVSVQGRTYIAVAGAGHIWPILGHDRSIDRKRWVYRGDVL